LSTRSGGPHSSLGTMPTDIEMPYRDVPGVQRIPIETPKGRFEVWTRRVGDNPRAKLLRPSSGGYKDEARQFRTSFGLRSDDGWIASVARDPGSDRITYGVPLTAEEVDELGRRIRDVEAIRDFVITYGEEHPEAWGGAYIDQDAGGVLVAQFTANLEQHRLALLGNIWPKASLDIQQVRWTQTQLEAAKERISKDEPWFATLPAVVTSLGLDDRGNRVVARISTPNPDASDLVLAHFGFDDSLLQVMSDGTGARLLGRGTLIVTVVDASNRPVSGVGCAAYPDLDGATDPHPDPMPTTDGAGRCLLDLRATGYWIHIERRTSPTTLIAIGRALVVAGKSATIQIVAGN
jgi:hypothetical protein